MTSDGSSTRPSSPGPERPSDDERLCAAIESTVLGPGVPADSVDALCREAVEHGLRGVCVPPAHVSRAVRGVEGSPVRVVTVANFPFGDGLPSTLEAAARAARTAGAHEVDVVFPLHCVPSRDWGRAGNALDAFERGLAALPHKVILETAAWEPGALRDLVAFVRSRETSVVKTSTGFHPGGGATLDAVRTLRRELPNTTRIKAAGGIRSRSFALDLLDAGADFLGTSSAADLIAG